MGMRAANVTAQNQQSHSRQTKLGHERPLATLCYRSRANTPPSTDNLTKLVSEARARNKSVGVTGMLVHEGDRFFQWLEGPSEALDVLWSSIRHDDRHGEIELLGEGVTPIRLFSDWDLRFLSRLPRSHEAADPAAAAASALSDGAARLAQLALEGDDEGVESLVRARRAAGEDTGELCRVLLEPAAHLLGDWWCADRCNSFEITVALSKLQNLVRSLEVGTAGGVRVAIPGQRVLISPPPREPHMLGAVVLGGFFRQAGWSVHAEFPKSDDELMGLVSAHWFDAIALTLSDVFTRRERLKALVKTIAEIRAASRNPTMAVLVGGRAFRTSGTNETRNVGADVHYGSASEAIGDLDYWLFMHRFSLEPQDDIGDEGVLRLRTVDVVRMITPALVRRLGQKRDEPDQS